MPLFLNHEFKSSRRNQILFRFIEFCLPCNASEFVVLVVEIREVTLNAEIASRDGVIDNFPFARENVIQEQSPQSDRGLLRPFPSAASEG